MTAQDDIIPVSQLPSADNSDVIPVNALPKSTGNPVTNFIGNIAHGAVEPFAKLAQAGPVASISRGLGSMAGGQGFNTSEPQGGVNLPVYGNIQSPKTPEEYAGNAVKAGSMFLAPEAGLGPAFGAYGAGQAMTENKGAGGVAIDALKNAALGKGVELAAPVVAAGASAVGKAIPQGLKNAGTSLLESSISNLVKYTKFNSNPARGLLEEGISGSSAEEIQFKALNRLEELDQAKKAFLSDPSNANKFVNASNLFDPLDQAMAQAKTAPEINSGLINKLEKARIDLEGMIGDKDLSHLSLQDADALKQQVGNLSKFSGNAAEKDFQTFDKVSNSLYGNLNAQIHEVSPEIAAFNQRQADLIPAVKALDRGDMLAGKTGKIANLSRRGGFWTGLGAVGAALHGNQELAASLASGAVGEEIIPTISGNAAIRSRVARGLYGAGEGLESTGQTVKDLINKARGIQPAVAEATQQSPYIPPTRGAGPYAGGAGSYQGPEIELPDKHIPYGQKYSGGAGNYTGPEIMPPKENVPYGQPYAGNLSKIAKKRAR